VVVVSALRNSHLDFWRIDCTRVMSNMPAWLRKRGTVKEIGNGRDENTGIFGGCFTPLEQPELRSTLAIGHRWTE